MMKTIPQGQSFAPHDDGESGALIIGCLQDGRISYSRNRVSQQASSSISESSSDYSETATSVTPLHRPSMSLCSNDSMTEADHLGNHYEEIPSDYPYYNLVTRQRRQPSTPKKELQSSCCCSGFLSSLKSHCLILLTLFSVAFSLLSCVLTALNFLSGVSPAWESSVFKEGDFETCIPCAKLANNDYDDDGSIARLRSQLTIKVTDVESICCAQTSGQMSAMVELMIKQKNKPTVVQPPTKRKLTFSPVSAHKHLYPWSVTDQDETQFLKKKYHLKMSPDTDISSEHSRHVTVRNNSLQVQFSGWYLVYSSVYFKPVTDKPCGTFRHQTWGHFIHRLSPNRMSTSGTLVQSAHTCCDNCTDDHHTSYAAGVFLLEAGDSIFVEVSGGGLILFDGEASYLGLAMLGSWDSASSNDDSDSNLLPAE